MTQNEDATPTGVIDQIRQDDSLMLRISARGELCFVRSVDGKLEAAQYDQDMELNRMQSVSEARVCAWLDSGGTDIDVREIKEDRFQNNEAIAGVAKVVSDG